MTARVFIVDDHPLVRSGVRTELGDAVSVVGEAGDVDEAVKGLLALDDDALDVVLLDVHMPGGGGVEILRRVGPKKPALRFLALSVSDAPEDVIAVIRAGARGYITKSATGAEIAEAIERIAAGDAAFSPRLAGFVLDAFSSGVPASVAEAPVDAELEQLTPREREVLQLIARGYAYKEVGRRLNVSVKTVETHVSSVLRKLQLSSRHELARWATDRRLI
ncbi:MAG TPA: response regulator transcription factor [Acidimicrobiales bacterium]|nr:response regulator transcription factor [Acidimicrobiales bacterium]